MVDLSGGGSHLHPLSLYFHIPFCSKKCDYCHFYVLPDKEAYKIQLMRGFKQEWALRQRWVKGGKVETIYFGGGTPALLGPERIAEILSWIPYGPETEITLEANPENITKQLMQAYAEAGINRVSIGLQTLDDPLLITLGRLHTAKKAKDAVHITAEAGIHNISVDLMYDLPGQSLQHWKHSLMQVADLPIQHLSLYNLTIEPHTVFFKKQAQLTKILPDPETSLAMYTTALAELEALGLRQYEISAFAKEGFLSRHNSGYWTGRAFLGLGPSAFSYIQGCRFRNIAHLNKYCAQLEEGKLPVDFEETLEPEARFRELLAIHLRLRAGVQMSKFNALHGTIDVSKNIQKLERDGLLEWVEDTLRLTQKGILFYDTVATEII